MNRLLLSCAVLLPAFAFANAHHSSGGSSGDSPFDKEGACLVWSAPDGGLDGGADDAAEAAEAADAGHPGEVCTQHAKSFGCSVLGFGAPVALLAIATLKRRRPRQKPALSESPTYE